MNPFTEAELAYLTGEPRLARLATVGLDGMPHIAPVGWSYNAELGTIDIGGHDFARTKKFRDAARTGRAAIVVDDVLPPWRPRGVEVRGIAEAIGGPPALIRLHPRRIVSWGLESTELGARQARDVGAAGQQPPARAAERAAPRAHTGDAPYHPLDTST
jgi:pyridoxamine 5'-phosphate oxidase family protein